MSGRSPRGVVAAVLSPEPYRGPPARIWVQAGLILLASVIFGFQFVTFKEAFKEMGPWTLLALRALLSLPLMFLMMGWARVPVTVTRASLTRVLVPASLLVGSHVCFMLGVHRLTAGLTATLVSMTPIFSVGLSMLFRVERVGLLGIVGSVIGVAGVAIATGALNGDVDGIGLALILGSNAFYSLSFIALKQMALRLSSAIYLIVMMVLSLVVFVPLALALEGFSVTFTWRAGGSVAYIVIFGQAIAYVAALALLRFGGVFQATLLTPLIPVFAISFAILLLGEPLLGRELAGGALIIGGVVLAIVPLKRGLLARRRA